MISKLRVIHPVVQEYNLYLLSIIHNSMLQSKNYATLSCVWRTININCKWFQFELKLYPYFTFCYFLICSNRFAYFIVLCISWTKGAKALPLDSSVALVGNVLNIMNEIHKITRSIESCTTFLYFNTETLHMNITASWLMKYS